ncbi:hypothetical protein TNCV_1771091 [Trichonephila clavipes]|nr:hypothetical protein TNCV_1771091 [Trichonephila clavipes]
MTAFRLDWRLLHSISGGDLAWCYTHGWEGGVANEGKNQWEAIRRTWFRRLAIEELLLDERAVVLIIHARLGRKNLNY